MKDYTKRPMGLRKLYVELRRISTEDLGLTDKKYPRLFTQFSEEQLRKTKVDVNELRRAMSEEISFISVQVKALLMDRNSLVQEKGGALEDIARLVVRYDLDPKTLDTKREQ